MGLVMARSHGPVEDEFVKRLTLRRLLRLRSRIRQSRSEVGRGLVRIEALCLAGLLLLFDAVSLGMFASAEDPVLDGLLLLGLTGRCRPDPAPSVPRFRLRLSRAT